VQALRSVLNLDPRLAAESFYARDRMHLLTTFYPHRWFTFIQRNPSAYTTGITTQMRTSRSLYVK
jgi:hypothetical protein